MTLKGIVRKKATSSKKFVGGDFNIVEIIKVLSSLEVGENDKLVFEYNDEENCLLSHIEINIDKVEEKMKNKDFVEELELKKEELELINSILNVSKECVKDYGFIRIDSLF